MFLFFISQKTDKATFFILFHRKLWRHLFCLSLKNVDILILTYDLDPHMCLINWKLEIHTEAGVNNP